MIKHDDTITCTLIYFSLDPFQNAIQWAWDRNYINLRHNLELIHMNLCYATHSFKQAKTLAKSLYVEAKNLQDYKMAVKVSFKL